MALGTRRDGKQHDLWVTSAAHTTAPVNSFYDKLNQLLRSICFDNFVEEICEPYYAKSGRPSVAPSIYFRMTLIGYFESLWHRD